MRGWSQRLRSEQLRGQRSAPVEQNVRRGGAHAVLLDGATVVIVANEPLLGHPAPIPVPDKRRVVSVTHAPHVVGHREQIIQCRYSAPSFQRFSFCPHRF